MAGSGKWIPNVWDILDTFPSIDDCYKYIYFVKK